MSGKRTLAKLNAFDFVVTVALAEGITALALLIGLQYAVAWISSRSRRVERLVKSEPTLVYRDGFRHGAMRRERVSSDELRQAPRGQGHAMVLETDGTLSIPTDPPTFLTGSGHIGAANTEPTPGRERPSDRDRGTIAAGSHCPA